MPAELLAHRGQHLVGIGRFLARAEASLQGHGDDRDGYVFADAGDYALLARLSELLL